MTPAITVGLLTAGAGCAIALALLSGERSVLLARAGATGGSIGSAGRGGIGLSHPRPLMCLAAGGLGWLVWRLPGLVLCAAVVAAVPLVRERRRSAARTRMLEDQLADAALSLAAAMRAGMSLAQAIGYAAEESEAPLAETLARVFEQISLGVPLEEALGGWEGLSAGPDAELLVGVLKLHRRTGGELPVVLDQLAKTLAERRAAAQEVHALTAQARLSGAILGLLPIGFFLFLALTSREQIDAAFRTPTGLASVVIGFGLQGLAFLWIRSLLRVA